LIWCSGALQTKRSKEGQMANGEQADERDEIRMLLGKTSAARRQGRPEELAEYSMTTW
jgi:hypothetical protein